MAYRFSAACYLEAIPTENPSKQLLCFVNRRHTVYAEAACSVKSFRLVEFSLTFLLNSGPYPTHQTGA